MRGECILRQGHNLISRQKTFHLVPDRQHHATALRAEFVAGTRDHSQSIEDITEVEAGVSNLDFDLAGTRSSALLANKMQLSKIAAVRKAQDLAHSFRK